MARQKMNDCYIGVLSGTSMDAVDVIVVDFSNTKPHIYAKHSVKLPPEYRRRYLDIINAGGACTLEELGDLDNWTGNLFANAVIELLQISNIDRTKITAIGSHGQTLWHAPKSQRPFTLQIGDPNIIAVKTGIPTVADFRRANIAAGGQGAPLAPALHKAIFSHNTESRCIVNIGGFSNISILEENKYFGFDTGPGNCLMDYWVKKHFNLDFDVDGKIAASGTVNDLLLNCLLEDPYFKLPTPKSTGREYFNAAWLNQKLMTCNQQNANATDVLATLLKFTVQTIANAIKQYAISTTSVYVCGGGAYNIVLLQTLGSILDNKVQTTLSLGVDPSWVEATLFAWLAKETIAGKVIELPTSGSEQHVILGGIYGRKNISR